MKKWLSVIWTAGLLLYPFATFAADYGSQTSQKEEVPPVAQTLVREGDFAIKLAAELDLGSPKNEADAEDMLAKAGVVPLNGWISDYPMTPEIIGQLQSSIAKAASEGKLQMSAEEATKGFYYLTSQMNLPTPAGSEQAPAERKKVPAEKSNPTVINNYYYDQGPPIITYYPPPYDYAYLYAWVPYPVWWFGFWFPGFYICHSFTTVVVAGPVFVNGTVIVNRRAVVSNRIIDPVTRTAVVVDPVMRTTTGGVRSVTMLRTESGRTFTSLTEMRSAAGVVKQTSGRPGTLTKSEIRRGGFASPEARKSAESIYSRSRERGHAGLRPEGKTARGGERWGTTPGAAKRFNAPSRGNERPYITPGAPERSFKGPGSGEGGRYNVPRSSERPYYNRPSMMRNRESVRPFTAPRAPSRSFSGPATSGGSTRSWFSSGGRQGGKGVFDRDFRGGAMCRGKC